MTDDDDMNSDMSDDEAADDKRAQNNNSHYVAVKKEVDGAEKEVSRRLACPVFSSNYKHYLITYHCYSRYSIHTENKVV